LIALIRGSTYHSVLGILDNLNKEIHEGIGVRKVQERLRGVEYIFLDEISMVSCNALYTISARLALHSSNFR
jgi:ATP-dependent DNA helicase PIF1